MKTIQEVPFDLKLYGVDCDNCNEHYANHDGYNRFPEFSDALDYAKEDNWVEYAGKHYCNDCDNTNQFCSLCGEKSDKVVDKGGDIICTGCMNTEIDLSQVPYDVTQKAIIDIQTQREEIIKQRLKEIGVETDFEKIKEGEDPCIKVEYSNPQEQTFYYYFNHGTERERLVTFRESKPEINTCLKTISIVINYEYY